LQLPSTLEELKLTDCGLENDHVFNSMVSYLSTKKSMTRINPRDFSLYVMDNPLKKLDLSGNYNLSTEQWVQLFQSLRNVKLGELNMLRIELIDEVENDLIGTGSPILVEVTRFLKRNKMLKVLKLPYFPRSPGQLVVTRRVGLQEARFRQNFCGNH
jgi:hypothetical protein